MSRDAAMSEAQLEAAILEAAGLFGWLRFHARPAVLPSGKWATHQAGDKGFPDLFLARRGSCPVAAELKSARGKPTPEQVAWLDVLGACGVTACLWRPADWLGGGVEAFLRGEGPAPGIGAWRTVGGQRGAARRLRRKLEDGVRLAGMGGPATLWSSSCVTVRQRVLG